MKKKLPILFCFLVSFFCSGHLFAQYNITWEKNFGGTNAEIAEQILATADGGYLIGAFTYSTDFDGIGNHGKSDFLIIKLDPVGNLQWKHVYGGDSVEGTPRVVEINNGGGYYLYGISYSENSGNVSGHYGQSVSPDIWVLKLDINGNIVWEKNYGGTGQDIARGAVLNASGGLTITGNTTSPEGINDITFAHGVNGIRDFWVFKTDADGTKLWDSCYGGNGPDESYQIIETLDQGYVISGNVRFVTSTPTLAQLGQVTEYFGDDDVWVIKIDSVGQLQWETSIGGSGKEIGTVVSQQADGSYFIAASTNSSNNGITNKGGNDILVAKLDVNGNIIWKQTFGGAGNESPTSIINNQGGVLVLGTTSSNNLDVSYNHGGQDFWMLKISSNGVLLDEYTLGGSNSDAGYSIASTNDGQFIVSGTSSSLDGDVSANIGLRDIWVAKFGFCNYPLNFNIQTTAVNDTLSSSPLIVALNNNTPNIGNYHFTWNFGDNIFINSDDPLISHEYLYNGTYQVSLTAIDTASQCAETIYPAATIFCNSLSNISCTHTANIIAPDTINACSGSVIPLQVAITGSTSYTIQWYVNGQIIVGETDTILWTYLAGNFVALVQDLNNSNCIVSSNNIVIINTTLLSIAPPVVTQNGIPIDCQGLSIELIASPGYTSYLWNNGDINDTINTSEAGSYSVLGFMGAYCNASSVGIDLVTSSLLPPEICNISVDTSASEHNIIFWDYANQSSLDSILIYRKGLNGIYAQIGSVIDSETEFTDTSVSGANDDYSYKILLKHYCSPSAFPDSSGSTIFSLNKANIHLTTVAGSNSDMVLVWSGYPDVVSYYILRDTSLTSNLNSDFLVIDSIQAPAYYYVDHTPNFGTASRYRIEAVSSCADSARATGNRNRTRSNTSGLLGTVPEICSYQLSDSSIVFNNFGGQVLVTVYPTYNTCSWVITDTISWISVSPNTVQSDTGIVVITVGTCSDSTSQTAIINIAGINYTIVQNCLVTILNEKLISDATYFFPNPASDKLNFVSKKNIKSVAIYDAVGARISNISIVDNKIDISVLPIGLYLITIEHSDNSVQHSKFLKL